MLNGRGLREVKTAWVAASDVGTSMGCGASTSAVEGGGSLGRKENVRDEYDLGTVLGQGSFATARLAVRKMDGKQVAIKTLMRNHESFDKQMLKAEITVMRAVTHERCICLLDVLEDQQSVHLVEEVASGGELFDRICNMPSGHLTEKDAAFLIGQVLEGLAHMHAVGAIHRDLKPENLLLMSSNKEHKDYLSLKIADFGMSALMGNPALGGHSMTTVCGTPDYLAPEMCAIVLKTSAKGKGNYDEKVDVWAIGVILYVMICGFPPFFR